AGGKGIGVLHHVAGVEVLHRALVEGKGPGAAGEGERAVTVVAGAGRDIGKGRVVVGIDVTDGERAAGGGDIAQVALADRPTEGAGNHGSIIGAVNSDCYCACCTINRSNVKNFTVTLAYIQLVICAVSSKCPVTIYIYIKGTISTVNSGWS